MKTKSLLAMLKNRLNRENIYSTADYWNSKADELTGDAVSMWPNNNLNKLYNKEQMEYIESRLIRLNGKHVLDVGCGTGRLSRYLSSRGAKVTGIDFSDKAIQIANSVKFNVPITYRVESIFNLQERDKYDVVFSWGCIVIAAKNREELIVALKALRNAMKTGGEALMLEPIHQGFVHRVLDMNIKEFCEVMEMVGFEVSDVKNMHFWPIRYVLAFMPLPAFITTPAYHLGQWLMRWPFLKNFGDYKAVSAIAI